MGSQYQMDLAWQLPHASHHTDEKSAAQKSLLGSAAILGPIITLFRYDLMMMMMMMITMMITVMMTMMLLLMLTFF